MDEFENYKSRCCRAAVIFKEDVGYGESKGFYCSKCLEYCEVIVPKPTPNMQAFNKPAVDVHKAPILGPAISGTQQPKPLTHYAYHNTKQLALKQASDLVKSSMQAANGNECNKLLQKLADDILKL